MNKDITQKLLGHPTSEELKALYLQFDFDRARLAAHLNISTAKLNKMRNDLLGNVHLPSTATYMKMYNDFQWYTYWHPDWTIPPKSANPKYPTPATENETPNE